MVILILGRNLLSMIDNKHVNGTLPGNTEAERMDNAVRMLFSASKEAFAKEEVKRGRARERKKREKRSKT